jgi:hypothetical protein
VVTLVLDLCFLPAIIPSKDGAPWPMRGFSDGGAYTIDRPLLLIVGAGILGACSDGFQEIN